jgi:hypothetical protein
MILTAEFAIVQPLRSRPLISQSPAWELLCIPLSDIGLVISVRFIRPSTAREHQLIGRSSLEVEPDIVFLQVF